MKKLVMVALIVGVFAAGVYVGRLPVADLVLGSHNALVQPAQQEITKNAGEEKAASIAAEEETAYTVSQNQLSVGQRELLTRLGINADAITITAAMIACAEAKLGAPRLAEIQAGAMPTFSEGASLLVCYR